MAMLTKKNLYPDYLTASGWNALLSPRAAYTRLPPSRRFKTVVIGAGYTGLAAARRFAELEPAQQVLVIDASTVGEGAAGRNSGFLSRLPNRPRANRHGTVEDAAQRQMRIYKAGNTWLRELVAEHNIDCEWDETSPRFSAAATAAGVQSLQATARSYKRWGVPCEEFDVSALQQRIGTDYYQYGYQTPYNTFVQPAALIRGLADSLPENVQLVECLPASRIDHGHGRHIVHTRAGAFECDRLIVANNGFARRLGILKDRLITIYTYAGLTVPLDHTEQSKLGKVPAWGIIPAHRLGSTLRKTRDGRFMVRSAYSYERELPPDQVGAMLSQLYRNRYPHMRSHVFEHVWGGCTALTLNGGMYFGEVRPGLYASAGCNGAGVLRGSIQGKLLAELACREDSDTLSDLMKLEGPNWIPPEPMRKIGVLSVIAMERRKAGLER
ncbi:FAD-dependent oxidoreductase [Pusillimonas sp. TS35]|uniref:NAD(P)/FAD-dependent oxidoreductase n=1 Tax=Paracandidimonas lactea TaxID=2895524 RepID=UPI00136DD536|nr:FAD-binding oxidoreductase [Paracandidimonas lactea]MYN13692.1 FAD-dependent oxidoreductase [Pusillimonas sp. TS35]